MRSAHFRSFGWEIATLSCKTSTTLGKLQLGNCIKSRSTLPQLQMYTFAAPARKSQLCSASLVCEVHFRRSGWEIATLLPLRCRFTCRFRCRSHLFCYWQVPHYHVDSFPCMCLRSDPCFWFCSFWLAKPRQTSTGCEPRLD